MCKNVGAPLVGARHARAATRAAPTVCIFLLFAMLSGCAGMEVTYVPLKAGHFPSVRPAREIPVLTGTVDEPYEELGIIIVRKSVGSLEEEIMEKFQEEAMVRGAEAVIKVQAEKKPLFSVGPFFFSFPFPGIEARGVAIRFIKRKQ